MKFLGLPILILCVYLSQLSLSTELSDEYINERVKDIRDSIYGVNEQFMDDVKVIMENYRNNSLIVGNLIHAVLSMAKMPKYILQRENEKIDEKMVRDYHSVSTLISRASALEIAMEMGNLKIIQSILSKHLPPERYCGVMNFVYIRLNKNATTDEIRSTLGYLYGSDAAAPKTSFLDKLPDLKSSDCLQDQVTYSMSETENTLKSMIDIKPKVIEDFTAIRDNFPCNYAALRYLQTFVGLLKRTQGNDSKVGACVVKANPGNWEDHWPSNYNTREHMEGELYEIESTLSTRLPDETYGDIITFLKVTMPGTPIDEIEKALEYLYEDVPKANCSEKESAKAETK